MTTHDDGIEGMLQRFAGDDKYRALDALYSPPGQGPGEDGEEGTGPTAEQLREMHEEHREACLQEARDLVRRILEEHPGMQERSAARLIVAALRREGLL